MAGGCSAAKPLWSEVIVFLGGFLRQRISYSGKSTASSVAILRMCIKSEVNYSLSSFWNTLV